MQQSALPTASDLGSMVAYVWANPYLFISSSTVMTTGLIVGAAVVAALPARSLVLRRVAPALAILLAYFGIGAFALSLEVLLRFHPLIPYETEVQLVSGIGHLAEALLGIAILWRSLFGHTRAAWLWAHTAALGYWTVQVAVLTPPWFAFQGQLELVTTAALVLLAIAAAANVLLWWLAWRSRHSHRALGGRVAV